MGATREIAACIHRLSYASLPRDVVEKARLCLTDWVAAAAAGYVQGERDFDEMRAALSPCFGAPHAVLVGKQQRLDVMHAALFNGAAAHYLDFDDVHMGSITHPSLPVVAAALAVGEYCNVSGKQLLAAIVAGIETECCIGEAMGPAHYAAGWHATATLGGFGACAAVAKLLELDTERIVAALGIAGTQAFGLQQAFGTMCKPFHGGKAASNGILAAFLASGEFSAPMEILEGEAGFAQVLGQGLDTSRIAAFGNPYSLGEVVFKRYPSCYSTHAAIRCMLHLRERHKLTAGDVVEVTLQASPSALSIAGKSAPRTGLEGKFSNRYCVAVALLRGKVELPDFSDAAVNAPAVQDLMSHIQVLPDAALSWTEVTLALKTRLGKEIRDTFELSSTDAATPLEDWQSAVQEKAAALLGPVFGEARTQELLQWLATLEDTEDVAQLAALLY